MFLRRAWYVAAWAHEVTAAPFARTLLDEPVVLFRTPGGTIAALQDRCSHRHLPLHMGRVTGDTIQCGYHGLRFDGGGRCVEIPGQEAIPARAAIRSYPAAERDGFIWVWMGGASDADEREIPACPWVSDARYDPVGSTNHVQCNYTLLTENLLDSSHINYVHSSTVGGEPTKQTPRLEVSRLPTGVRLERWLIDVPAPPTYLRTGQVSGNVDRWQVSEFVAPALVRQRVGGADTGTGAPEGHRERGVELYLTHFMTPETERSCFYFWSVGRDFRNGDADTTAALFEDVGHAFAEDKAVLEAQQRANERFCDLPQININADAAAFQSRRFLARLIEAEAARAQEASVESGTRHFT